MGAVTSFCDATRSNSCKLTTQLHAGHVAVDEASATVPEGKALCTSFVLPGLSYPVCFFTWHSNQVRAAESHTTEPLSLEKCVLRTELRKQHLILAQIEPFDMLVF